MNASIFWRVFWKEFRLQWPLWLAMAALTVLAQFAVIAYESFQLHSVALLYLIAVALPSLYALGCGATLFAGEHEADTFEFQRSLPVHPLSVFVGKIAFALVSVAALWGFTMGAGYLWSRNIGMSIEDWKPNAWQFMVWGTFGFFGVETLLWAVFFSILTKRVLPAAVFGVATASVIAHSTATLSMHISTEPYVAALPWRGIAVLVLLFSDVWLATRWFRERRQRSVSPNQAVIDWTGVTRPVEFSKHLCGPSRTATFFRLVWQHWRQSRWMTIAIVALLIPLTGLLTMWLAQEFWSHDWFFDLRAGRIFPQGDQLLFCMRAFPVLAIPPLLGIITFLADQRRNSYRFLADRGVAPKYVWLSRQLVTLGIPASLFILLLLGFLLLIAACLPTAARSDFWRGTRIAEAYAGVYGYGCLMFGVFGYVILGIAVGQLCSMFLRSVVLAALFSLLITGILATWCVLMLFWQVNWLWSILPILVAPLLATRLRTADWLAERNSLGSWLRPGLALLAPAVALLIVVPLYRVHQIPFVDPGFSPEELTRPITAEDQATFDMYRQAYRALMPMRRDGFSLRELESLALTSLERPWVDANSEAVEAALKASQRPIGNLADSRSLPSKGELAELARLLVCSATKSESDGKLDVAMEKYLAAIRIAVMVHNCYAIPILQFEPPENRVCCGNLIEMQVYAHLPSWAARPGQTPERILAAASKMEELTSGVSPSNGLKLAYLRVYRFLSGDVDAILGSSSDSGPNQLSPLTMLWMHLPWERDRATRLLNCQIRPRLDSLSTVEQVMRNNGGIVQQPPRDLQQPECRSMPYTLCGPIDVPPVFFDPATSCNQIVADYTSILTARRAVRLVLTLEAWKLQHDSLPKTLDELVGHGLDRLPVDPHTGKPFLYLRDGLKIPLEWCQPHQYSTTGDRDYQTGKIAAGTPMIWACGMNLRRPCGYMPIPNRESVLGKYEVFPSLQHSATETYRPRSEYEIWQAGWPFPIP
jgi:hypothetical protein